MKVSRDIYDEMCQGSYHFDFPETLTLLLLDQALRGLREERSFDPEYLFVAKQDYKAIAEQVVKEPERVSEMFKAIAEQAAKELERIPEIFSDIQVYYLNRTTGRLVILAAVPGLKTGRVIAGFFK